MLTVSAYFDESGTHESAATLTVAGYVSTPEQWGVFESEWRTALDDFALSEGQPFHMTDCMSGKVKPYHGWTDQDKRFRVARLIEISNRHTLATVGAVVQRKMFDETFSKAAKRFVGGPYGLAASLCFLRASEFLDELYPSARIAYIFESGAQGAGEVRKVFDWNYKEPEERQRLKLLSLSFEDKREKVQLQASDILAHQLCLKSVEDLGLGTADPRVSANMKLLGGCRQRSWISLDQEEMSKWAMVADVGVDYHGSRTRKRRPRQRRRNRR